MRHNNMLCILACVALAVVTEPAVAQSEGELSVAASARAAEAGIPVEPLLRKIREGEAKRVPPQRIEAAVAALHERLVRGKSLCGEAAPAVCVEAAADALANGLGQAQLEGLIAGDGSPLAAMQRTRAFVAASTLRARGATPDATIDQVSAALSRGEVDSLLPQGEGADAMWSPPAVGRGGELPVQNPTRDRDSTGRGKAWGRDKARGKPVDPGGRGRPDSPGNSENAPGNSGKK